MLTDPISGALGLALGAALYHLARHLRAGLRLCRELKETRRRIALEHWQMTQRQRSRITYPSPRNDKESP